MIQLLEYIILGGIFVAQIYVTFMVISKTRQISKFLPPDPIWPTNDVLTIEQELTPEAKAQRDARNHDGAVIPQVDSNDSRVNIEPYRTVHSKGEKYGFISDFKASEENAIIKLLHFDGDSATFTVWDMEKFKKAYPSNADKLSQAFVFEKGMTGPLAVSIPGQCRREGKFWTIIKKCTITSSK